jgi:hypothetical protein
MEPRRHRPNLGRPELVVLVVAPRAARNSQQILGPPNRSVLEASPGASREQHHGQDPSLDHPEVFQRQVQLGLAVRFGRSHEL